MLYVQRHVKELRSKSFKLHYKSILNISVFTYERPEWNNKPEHDATCVNTGNEILC